jgi:hypothetical protein
VQPGTGGKPAGLPLELELKSVVGGSFAVNGTPFRFGELVFELCELELSFFLLSATAKVGAATTKTLNTAKAFSIPPLPHKATSPPAINRSIL